ncbi:hypothetical protein FE257_008999 [Aspergillus nanangensis]|uniref:Rhodopsin domain-containing protein n=1 Tax=Aspergillus nanangensis TaxID=2582783 RepID=A0AAD4GYI2_ASPNN|nr:hypothetical protein FE257_008999 [Aspergillus nanangensis]
MAVDYVTPLAIQGTGYALIGLTTLVVIARFSTSLSRLKELKAEDYLLALAYAIFLVLAILYIIIAPTLFKIKAVQLGQTPPYATLMEDSFKLQAFFFFTTGSLWLCLWMIKFSLLAMYKRLLNGRAYFIAWWGLLGFCIATLIGCILSSWLSCTSLKAWFTAGKCDTDRDHRAAAISLYFSFGVDILTDLCIMILPLRLIWNLRMSRSRKLSIGALFCMAWICMAVSIIRVIQLGHSVSHGTPEPAWLALWGSIEASVAVIIGCCPGLYRVIKARISKSQPSYPYDSYGFQMHTGVSASRSKPKGRDTNFSRISARVMPRGMSPNSSQEQLADSMTGDIVVTQRVSISVNDRQAINCVV